MAEKNDKKIVNAYPKGWVTTVRVEHLDAEGFGMAIVDGKRFHVTGALPGEEVRVKVTYSGKSDIHAVVTQVLRRSRSRAAVPACAQFPVCDGCPLVVMSYNSQLKWKKEQVEREISRYSSLQGVTVSEVTPSPEQMNYRHSAKLVIGGKFSDPRIGIYRRNSHEVVDISDCPTHHPLINTIVSKVKTGIRKGKVPIFSLRNSQGFLRYLLVRVSSATGQAMVVFVTARRSFNELHHLARYVQAEVPKVKVVVQNVNSSSGNVLLGPSDHYLTKAHVLTEKMGGVRFNVSPRSFFQINPGAARIIYEKVREWGVRRGDESVVDLYCGVGGISLFLSPYVGKVHGIEVVEAAVLDARANAEMNGFENCRFTAGDAAEVLSDLADHNESVDLLVLNPPRKGCEERVLSAAAAIKPHRIIYVSCSPFTLARDLDVLAQNGYGVVAIQPVDMFPLTTHVENVALLELGFQ